MIVDLPPEMADFIIAHFEKRIAYRKCNMPTRDEWIHFADPKVEAKVNAEVEERKGKTLEFIHNATLVIELLREAKK